MIARALIAAAVLALAGGAHAAPRPFTVNDLVALERVGNPLLSPDATRVVYTVRSTDLDKDRGITQLWMVDLSNPKAAPVQLTNDAASSSDPAWSAKGDAIYFLRSSQVWRMPAGGGSPTQVTSLPLDVGSFRVSPKGDRIAVTLDVFRDCADLQCTVKRQDERSKAKAKARIYDRMFVRHWDTWSDNTTATLFTLPLNADGVATGTPVNLSGALDGDVPSKPDGDKNDYAFSADGANIAISVRVAGKSEPWSTNFDIYEVPAGGGKAPRNLTPENKAWDSNPVYSPDGKMLAYRAMDRAVYESDRFHIVLVDLASGKKRTLAEKFDRSVEQLQWSEDSKHIYLTAQDIGQHRLYRIDVALNRVEPLTSLGSILSYDVRKDKIVVAETNLGSPAQIYALEMGSLRPLTRQNAAKLEGVSFGQYEQFSFAGAKGDKVYGYAVKPANFEPGKKYPLAFLVHGGPQGSFGNAWSYRWNPQIYANAGYAVVMIDFHGSTGYGQAFTDAITNDWGGKPLEDLKKGLAAAGARYAWIDTKNACALGASYGGYMMNWIEGNWSDGFKCIVNHAGIFDNRSLYYATEELWFPEHDLGGPYWEKQAQHEKHNPANYVKKWKTPMLVTHGEQDFRIAITQGLMTFTALQRQGIESKLVSFPAENHHILKPSNSVLWHQNVLDWLGQHLRK